jgi:hypothetical protein
MVPQLPQNFTSSESGDTHFEQLVTRPLPHPRQNCAPLSIGFAQFLQILSSRDIQLLQLLKPALAITWEYALDIV